MPMVHPCGSPGCNVLTMGELCVDHEAFRRRAARSRVLPVLAVAAAAAAAAFVRAHLPR